MGKLDRLERMIGEMTAEETREALGLVAIQLPPEDLQQALIEHLDNEDLEQVAVGLEHYIDERLAQAWERGRK